MMATIISKQDLGSGSTEISETEAHGISEIDKILALIEKIQGLLSNPVVQQIIQSIVTKFFPAGYDLYGNPLNYQQAVEQRKEFSADEVYKKLVQGIEMLIATLGEEVTLKELRDYLKENEQKVKEILKGFV